MKSGASKPGSSPKELPKRKDAPAPEGSFPIVAIGASAGGLEAYKEFFLALPADTGMGYVLIQHLDPSHQSMLAEIIAKATKMPVEEVRSDVVIQPDHVYVIPPNALMAIVDCVFQLSPRDKSPGQHLAVNFFMRSLAQEEKSRAIGIVLSGTGADGTLGLEDIKAAGGITFAQEPSTAKYDGMPRSAIDSGCVDFVLGPKDIAKEIRRIQNHPYVRVEPDADSLEDGKGDGEASLEVGKAEQANELVEAIAPPSHEKDLLAIVAQLRKSSGVDFSQYKPNTIHRRALRRMVILKLDSLTDYATYLKGHPEEGEKLFDDVLIPVTTFFRDFEAFEALKTQVYPAILKDKSSQGRIRMWAPGCSTGEETYSLAITLLEFLGDRASSFQVQIFGTDLNEKGIQKARAGIYRESIAEEISPERMARFFVKVEEGYRVNKAVRDMCVFARQNLAADPPFSQMNVVACRNLLIYIQPVLQKKIIPILHYALKPSGFLVLGSSESVSAFPELFSTVDKKHKIYAKQPVASRLHFDFAQSYYPAYPAEDGPDVSRKLLKSPPPATDEVQVQAEADRIVLKYHAPVGVVINNAMEVVQFRGRTTPYLEPAPGKPSLNLLKLARNGLALELRTLIGAARKKDTPVRKNGVQFDGNGQKRFLDLSVTPLGEKGREKEHSENRFYLVLFEETMPEWTLPAKGAHKTKSRTEDRQEIKGLKLELANAQDALRAAIESEDSMRGEFQSANEEILSANEELQSTNEELETSKEELQSTNEELNTVNAELRNKNAELQGLSNDIANLLNSTRIPVVMLDPRLCIRRITPAANRIVKATASDVGRPLGDIKLNIEPSDLAPRDLEEAIRKVLDSLQPVEREVRDLDDHWHRLTIQPYRTHDNKIEGVVLSLLDIDAVKRSEQYLQTIIEKLPGPLLVLDADLRVKLANETFCETFQVRRADTIGQMLYRLGKEQWNIPELSELLRSVLSQHKLVKNFSVTHDFPEIGRKTMLVSGRRIEEAFSGQRVPLILLTIEDITERKRVEISLARLAAIVECSDDAIIAKSLDGVIETWNRGAERLYGYTAEEAVGHPVTMLMPPDRIHEESAILESIRRGEHIEHYESVRRHKDGHLLDVSLTISPIIDAHGQIVGASKIARDISERKLTEAALIKSEKLATAGRLAATLAHEINNPLQAVANLVDLWARSPGLDAQGQASAKMAENELRRVTHLTQQALSFYRESASPVLVNVEESIDSVLNIYEKRFEAKRIHVTKRYRLNGTTIRTYPGELRQVLTTLLLNAIEALDAGGTIVIRARKASHCQNPAVRGVRVTVFDNGVGISARNIPRIFEPFFTTKGENGTGLGLWVASGIVDRSGGSILTRSSVHSGKHGTCFSIFLPTKS
jgi:two-component system CheB/CheR fusion protein